MEPDILSIGQTIASLLGTLSIWEAVKYWLNRKTNKRKEKSEADMSEFDVLRATNQFLQEQLKATEERYADQTARLRKTQDENFQLLREKGLLELQLSRHGKDINDNEDKNMED